MKNLIFLFALLILNSKLGTLNCTAQDIHFSQFYLSPLYLNPAMTGVIDGAYRAATNYRSQGGAGIATPYKTFSVSFDMALLEGKKKSKKKNGLGIGLFFFNDKAGSIDMRKTYAGLCLAYNEALNEKNFLSGGISMGYVQRALSSKNMEWENQFDGVDYNPNIPSGENNIDYDFPYIDLNGGMLWNFTPSNIFKGNMGISVSHFNRPTDSYYPDPGVSNKLNPKYVFHSEIQKKLFRTKTTLIPRFFSAFQGESNEIIIGISMKRDDFGTSPQHTQHSLSTCIYGGIYYRWDDAVVFNFEVEQNNKFSLGISYDITTSSFMGANSGKGGFEISLLYKDFSQGKKRPPRSKF